MDNTFGPPKCILRPFNHFHSGISVSHFPSNYRSFESKILNISFPEWESNSQPSRLVARLCSCAITASVINVNLILIGDQIC